MHEMTHIFAFNSAMLLLQIRTILKNIDGVDREVMVTPKVVAAAKKHFDCDDIIGVEWENQGDAEPTRSHWEARVMIGDYMIGISYEEMFI